MATVQFGNVSADMRLADDSYGIAAIYDFYAFLDAFEPVDMDEEESESLITITFFDQGGETLTVSISGNFAIGYADTFSMEGAGVRLTVRGGFSITESGDVFGTATEYEAVLSQNSSLLFRVSDIGVYFDTGTVYFPTDDVLFAGTDNVSAGSGNQYLLGYAGNDAMAGGVGNDTLDGGSGMDAMAGGDGSDVYHVDDAGDSITESPSAGTDEVRATVSYTLAGNVENLILLGASPIAGTGNDLPNLITGNDADNVINGGAGADVMVGGGGNDTYVVDNSSDQISESAAGGVDQVQSSANYSLPAQVENLVLTGSTSVNATGNDLDNVITGNAFANVLTGGGGNDTLNGGGGDDTLSGGSGNDTYLIGSHVGLEGPTSLNMQSSPGDWIGQGQSYSHSPDTGIFEAYLSDSTNDGLIDRVHVSYHDFDWANWWNLTFSTASLDGNLIPGSYPDAQRASFEQPGHPGLEVGGNGRGSNEIFGSFTVIAADFDYSGPDAIIESLSISFEQRSESVSSAPLVGTLNFNYANASLSLPPTLIEEAGAGMDTVQAGISYALAANVENLMLTGNGNLSGSGNESNNQITGNSGNNLLDGGSGNNVLHGGAGNDVMWAAGGADTLNGEEGDDYLEGGGGGDAYNGGNGYDTASFYWSNAGVTVNLATGLGTGGFAQGATLTAIESVRGSAHQDFLTGDGNNNTLTGEGGADFIDGGLGNNSLIGGDGSDVMWAVGGADVLWGDDGDDYLEGGGGGDTYHGGNGVDTASFYWSSTGVTANLALGTGSGGYAQGATFNTIENVRGSAHQDFLTGDSNNNTLTGEGGADFLDGGGGSNALIGGEGNDVMWAQGGADVLWGDDGDDYLEGSGGGDTYSGGAGIDTASFTWSDLGVTVSLLTGTGSGGHAAGASLAGIENVRGSAHNDYLIGDSGNNVLLGLNGADLIDGSTGNNILMGGDGADIIWAQGGSDVLYGEEGDDYLEGAGGGDTYNGGNGSDTASFYWSPQGVNVDLNTGAASGGFAQLSQFISIENARGSAFDDYLGGDPTNNTLWGNDGNDLLNGGSGGNDILAGDAGNDILEGMNGDDLLTDSGGNNLMNAGSGDDALFGDSGNEVYIGNTGNDVINTGQGADLIVFNRGDGQDIVQASTGADNSVSLGGNIRYSDMSFTKNGDDLVLNLGGASERITLAGWYAAPQNRSVINLQVIVEATQDFDAGSADPLLNRRIASFDFLGLAEAYDNAANPANWALTNALLAEHLGGSDTEALGGDITHHYGMNGNFANVGFDPVVGILSSPSFGSAAQTLLGTPALEQGVKRLN